MVVLHVASIDNCPFNGVCVLVPRIITNQQEIVSTGLVNVKRANIKGIKNQFEYNKKFDISILPEPFSKPDIVIFHEVYKVEFLKIANKLLKNNIPYIILPHGSLTREVQRKRWIKKAIGNLLLFNKFIKNARAIQCLSRNEMERIDFTVKKFVSTAGIDMPQKTMEIIDRETINISYIGRFDIYTKGLDRMVEAVAINADLLRESKCKINMYGPKILGQKEELQKLINSRNLKDIMIVHGEVKGREKETILLETDVFFQTSRTEALTLGLLEAMSYGIPCVITRGTTQGELVEKYDAGWVAENSVQSVADKLRQSIEERALWQKKSEAAKKSIEENYDWSVVVGDALNNYRKYL